ncbi:hypothetical protein [Microbacterium mangrovi]|uniref:hypothetical protein n=1 Tax=Microbacterium mangrovi TaxID=1348253 RepID=UPI0012E03FFD|nr:hypothetical protein [Microbacterium mangrovi]
MSLAAAVAGALLVPGAAYAQSDSNTKGFSGGKLTANVWRQTILGGDNCGSFLTSAKATKSLSYIQNDVDWDPIGIGASASIKGVGVSVSGNNGSSPAARVKNTRASYAGISGTVCASWSTLYIGVYSTASTKVGGTLITVSAHV